MTKRITPLLAVAVVVLVATASAALGGERPHSIASGPVTITESGSYNVTWDISVITPPAIIIMAPDVTLDLNGHSVGTPGFDNGDVILVGTSAHRLQIKDGRLVGGTQCISGATPDLNLSMDHVTCTGGKFGVHISSASAVSITRSEFSPARNALIIEGAYSLRFDGNTIRQALPYPAGITCGASFGGVTNGSITDNTFDCTAYDGTILYLSGTGVTRVVHNSLTGHDTRGCLQLDGRFIVRENSIEGCRYPIQSTGSGNRLVDNVVSGSAVARGIEVTGSDNTVAGNVISDCGYGIIDTGARNRISGNSVLRSEETGVWILGAESLISGNRIQSNRTGLLLGESSSNNTYKNNDLRGTIRTPVQDSGTDNVDGGGNVW
jgi:parallel beta-helix repeat protein